MTISLKAKRIALACLMALTLAFPAFSGEQSINLQGNSAISLGYGIIMASFSNRNTDNLEASITELLAKAEANDPTRLQLAMAQAKLGKPEAERALTLLREWNTDYSGPEEGMRLNDMGELNLYYLDSPEEAAEYFEEALSVAPEFGPHIFSSLFAVYSGHKKTFDADKALSYLEKQADSANDIRVFINHGIFSGMVGETERAREAAQFLDDVIPSEQAVGRVYVAPVWGWLGDAEQVTAHLEPGLKEQAIMYAPNGFRLYCDWLRQSPAYDAICEDKRFIEMWDRLYAFEPEGRGANIMVPSFENDD